MLGVLADNSDTALSLDDFALFTDRFHRRTNLHFGILLSDIRIPAAGMPSKFRATQYDPARADTSEIIQQTALRSQALYFVPDGADGCNESGT